MGFVEDQKVYFQAHNRILQYPAHTSKVHSVGWSCDGKRLASGSYDRTVSLFHLDSRGLSKEHTFRGHSDSVDQLCWSPKHPDMLATASGDKTVRIWDARTQRCTSIIPTKGENINIAWAPNTQTIAVGNKEDMITFIDTRTHKPKMEKQFPAEVNEISFNNTSDLFFLTGASGQLHMLCFPEIEKQYTWQAHSANCICIRFDPTGKYFAVGSADAIVSIWDCATLSPVRTVSRLDWPVRTVSFSHDGRILASASEDMLIDVADVESGERITHIPVDASTFSIAWHPHNYLLAYSCDDKYDRTMTDSGTVKLYGMSKD